MTNVDKNGEYPILDWNADDYIGEKITERCQAFNRLWKDKFLFHTNFDKMSDWKDRELWNNFAWQVFVEALDKNQWKKIVEDINTKVQNIADTAYADGVRDTKVKIQNRLQKLDEIVDDL